MKHGFVERGTQQNTVQFDIVLDVVLRLALLHFVERRLCDVNVAALDQFRDLSIEERKQKRADVRAVNVGVGVVAADAAHSGDEVFVVCHREIINVAITRRDFVDRDHRQRHQVAVDAFEATIDGLADARHVLADAFRGRMVGPGRFE